MTSRFTPGWTRGKTDLRVRTDLRHELTHALLHGVLQDVPLWLDEGLAVYFELPPANEGVNPHHLEVLCRWPSQPDLVRPGKAHRRSQDGDSGIPGSLGLGPPHAPRRCLGQKSPPRYISRS